MRTSDYKDLDVWSLAMEVTQDLYKAIRLMPYEERYGLSDQMKRAAVSIPSNIAEGQCRNSVKEFVHFLSISRGSCAELETQILLSQNLSLLDKEVCVPIILKLQRISKMLFSLSKSIQHINQ